MHGVICLILFKLFEMPHGKDNLFLYARLSFVFATFNNILPIVS